MACALSDFFLHINISEVLAIMTVSAPIFSEARCRTCGLSIHEKCFFSERQGALRII